MEPIQILIIDSDESTRELLRSTFESERELQLHMASSAEGAAEILQRSPNWALVVLNVWLSGKDGFSFVKELKQKSPKTRFIFLSQEGSKVEILKALRIGVSDYFEKPFHLDGIRQAVHSCVKSYLSSTLTPTILDFNVPPTVSQTPKVRHLKLVSSDYGQSPESEPSEEIVDQPPELTYTYMKKKWVEAFEVHYLTNILNKHNGNVSNAAREAKIDRSNFLRLMRRYGIKSEIYRKMAA